MENRIKGSIFIISASFLYSFIGVFSRFAGIGAFALVFYKLLLASFFFLLIFLFARRDIGKLRIDWKMAKFFIPYGFVVAFAETTFVCAYLNTSLANTAFLNGLAPVFVALLSFFFLRERVSRSTLFSVIIGIIGVGFIVGPDLPVILGGVNMLGDVLALVSAVGYAAFLLYGRERAKMDINIYYSVFWSYAIASVFVLPLNFAYGTFTIPTESDIWLVLLSLVCTNIAFILLCKGFEYIEAAKGSVVVLSEPLFVAINAFLFFGESLALPAVIGAVLICSSVFLAER